jgi:predicted membrane-bound mannosyltransferase
MWKILRRVVAGGMRGLLIGAAAGFGIAMAYAYLHPDWDMAGLWAGFTTPAGAVVGAILGSLHAFHRAVREWMAERDRDEPPSYPL